MGRCLFTKWWHLRIVWHKLAKKQQQNYVSFAGFKVNLPGQDCGAGLLCQCYSNREQYGPHTSDIASYVTSALRPLNKHPLTYFKSTFSLRHIR